MSMERQAAAGLVGLFVTDKGVLLADSVALEICQVNTTKNLFPQSQRY